MQILRKWSHAFSHVFAGSLPTIIYTMPWQTTIRVNFFHNIIRYRNTLKMAICPGVMKLIFSYYDIFILSAFRCLEVEIEIHENIMHVYYVKNKDFFRNLWPMCYDTEEWKLPCSIELYTDIFTLNFNV